MRFVQLQHVARARGGRWRVVRKDLLHNPAGNAALLRDFGLLRSIVIVIPRLRLQCCKEVEGGESGCNVVRRDRIRVCLTASSFLPNVNTSTLGGYQGAAGNTKGAAFRPHLQPSSNSPVDGSTDRGSWMGNPLLPGELSNRRGLCLKQGCAPTDYRTVSET